MKTGKTPIERVMGMDARVWQRHANPLSVYSRMVILPALALAVWSRVWIGVWALLPVVVVLLWVWLNPRFFAPPRDLDNWASRGVMGEQVFLGRRGEVPAHHRAWAMGLGMAAVPGLVWMIWALWRLDLQGVIGGVVASMLPKLWFMDRMNWLYADWLDEANKELGDV
ncbi:hypothetical protein N4R57_13090 [Rhodobacteraceae bacterium D3-12]|nr:hypothetical protein N4R57_13090 [Rhodobacteraceae bacterium D3-12]